MLKVKNIAAKTKLLTLVYYSSLMFYLLTLNMYLLGVFIVQMLLIKVLSSTIVFTLQLCNLLPYINLHTYKFIYTNLKSKKSYVIENRPVKMTAYTSVLPFKSINWVKTNTWTPDVLNSDKRFIYDSRSSCTENILLNFILTFKESCSSIHVLFTAWKVSVFGVILVRFFPHSDWIRRDT